MPEKINCDTNISTYNFISLSPAPVALGYVVLKSSQIIIPVCPICGKSHTHGWPDDNNPTPRVAHCAGNRAPKGYNILILGGRE